MTAIVALTVFALLIILAFVLYPARAEGFKARLWPRPCPCDSGIGEPDRRGVIYNPFIWPIISAEKVGDIDAPETLFSPDTTDHVIMTN